MKKYWKNKHTRLIEISLGKHKFKETKDFKVFECDVKKKGCFVEIILPAELSGVFKEGEIMAKVWR